MDSRLTDITEYFYFTESIIEKQNEIERYINECVILSNPNRKNIFQEMNTLNESTFTDKVKVIFARLRSFFAKIFQKFVETFSKLLDGKKAYLEKYKDIIIKKQFKISVKMKNHLGSNGGINRVESFLNNTNSIMVPLNDNNYTEIQKSAFDTANTGGETNKDGTIKNFKISQYIDILTIAKINKSEVNPSSDDIASELNSYFNGGDTEVEYTSTELQDNAAAMYKFLYSSDELSNAIKKYSETFQSAMTKSEKAYNDSFIKAKKLAQNVINNTNKPNSNESTKALNNYAAEMAKKASQDAEKSKNEIYTYSSVYDKMIYEFDIINSSSPSSSSTSSDIVKGGTNDVNTASASRKASDISKTATSTAKDIKNNTSGQNDKAASAAANAVKDKIDDIKGNKEFNLNMYQEMASSMVRAYIESRTMFFAAAGNEINTAVKEVWGTLSAHVRSYLGTVNDTTDDSQSPTTI